MVKVSVTIEKMQAVTILILAVAARAAEGETRLFLISGTGVSGYNGLYAEDEAGTHFKRVGGADNITGDHRYLWNYQGRWKIGLGETFNKETKFVNYDVEGNQQQDPPTTGWKFVGGSSEPNIRVEQLPSLLVSTLSQTNADRGSFTVDRRIVCELERGDWKYLTSEKVCDSSFECSNQMDRPCFEKKLNRTEAIILNGVRSTLAGVYKLQQWDDIDYYSRIGKLGFIYQPSSKQGLVIGYGENIWSATAAFRWSEGEKVWKNVEDGSLAGRSEGTTASEVQLTEIPDEMDLGLFEKFENDELFEEEKTIPDVGTICLSPKKKEKTFISFNSTEAGWHCDRTWHCQFGGFHFISSFRHYSSFFFSSSSSSFLMMMMMMAIYRDIQQQQSW